MTNTVVLLRLLAWKPFTLIFPVMLSLAVCSSRVIAADELEKGNAGPVSSFWGSIVESVASAVTEDVAGFALSALGLSGPSQEEADLKNIEKLLNDIDLELNKLVDEVEALECLTAQDQTTLTASIKNIQGLYDAYSNWIKGSPTIPCWEQSDVSGNVCFGQTGIRTWLDDVTDPENGVDAALDAINDVMIQTGNTGVIDTCVKTLTTNYLKGSGPEKYVFDWTGDNDNPGYYDQVQQLTNYYYGVQAKGTALLAEAYHLQACLALGTSQCRFTGQSADAVSMSDNIIATPSSPGDICNKAATGSQVLEDCTNAQNIVKKVYGNIKTQLIHAGAPYTNSLVGKVWSDDMIYVKSLEYFTNQAMVNGETLSDCTTPLSSKSPCGFTVGAYNLGFPNMNVINYAGYDYWTSPSGLDLIRLLKGYYSKTSGDTSGTLGQWMNSVGFKNAENKIVLTSQGAENTDFKEIAVSLDTICFIDTSILLSDSTQPWCDGYARSSNSLSKKVFDEETFTDYFIEAPFTGSSVRPDFYQMHVSFFTYPNPTWLKTPGWIATQQVLTQFHHFHWGATSLAKLPECSVRDNGTKASDNLNPGGIPSMCGSDLQNWLDQVLPKPLLGNLPAIKITSDLQIRIGSTVLESDNSNINVWAHLEYAGINSNNRMVWQLKRYGKEYGIPLRGERNATIKSDGRLEIYRATFTSESAEKYLWLNMNYSGVNPEGDAFWTLDDYGVY